eukprot:TRINITY_DN7424_c0_g1_i2.p1 TRINITY_DN7424_c0_g1~~TRINITY_DN7424_c0_g1_i2.p1  ORF type:complete len:217 (-),score=74.42 TRINITY_DN7424_c0_g1_i2:32-682(-)
MNLSGEEFSIDSPAELHDYVHGDISSEFSSGYAGDDVWDLESKYSEYEEAVFNKYKDSVKISAKKEWSKVAKKWHAIYALGGSTMDLHEKKELDGYTTEYCSINTTEGDILHDSETVEACTKVLQMVELREKWLQFEPSDIVAGGAQGLEFSFEESAFVVRNKESGEALAQPIGFQEFAQDIDTMMNTHGSGVVTSFAKNQLSTLSTKFALYRMFC